MALSNIRSAVKAVLVGVSGIGVVNDWEPFVESPAEFETYFRDSTTGSLLGWTMTREYSPEEDRDWALNRRKHNLVIRGYAAVNNAAASEKTFQDLVETVCVALRAQESLQLGGLCEFFYAPNVRIFEPRRWGGMLLHYTEITIEAVEAVVAA